MVATGNSQLIVDDRQQSHEEMQAGWKRERETEKERPPVKVGKVTLFEILFRLSFSNLRRAKATGAGEEAPEAKSWCD